MLGELFRSDGSRKYLSAEERNAFVTAAVRAGIPLNLVWHRLAHPKLSTTAVCAEALEDETRGVAAYMSR